MEYIALKIIKLLLFPFHRELMLNKGGVAVAVSIPVLIPIPIPVPVPAPVPKP